MLPSTFRVNHRVTINKANSALQWSKIIVQGLFWKLWICSLFVNTYKNRKYNVKKINSENVYGDSLEFIHKSRTKGYVHNSVRSRLLNCAIIPVFWKCLRVFFQNISPFSKRMKPNLFANVSTATEHNAQRNELSLQAKIFSGDTHFRKTLKAAWSCNVHLNMFPITGTYTQFPLCLSTGQSLYEGPWVQNNFVIGINGISLK